jgi:hypothetical protein
MKTHNLVAIIFFIVFYKTSAYAQVKFECAGKAFVIPVFRTDTIKKSFSMDQFEKLKILAPIGDSKFKIELRGYYEVVNPLSASVVVIKGNRDTLFAEIYYYRFQRKITDTVAPAGFKTILSGKKRVYFSVKNLSLSKSVISQLIKSKLFELPDAILLRDSLSNAGIKIARSMAFDQYDMSFQLKVLNNYRSFYCHPFMAYANPKIKQLVPEKRLFETFDKIYNQSGQEPNHLYP